MSFLNDHFGNGSREHLAKVATTTPTNTARSHKYIWNSFEKFCDERGYVLEEKWPLEKMDEILADWALNMRKGNGAEYKDTVVKLFWNCTAKQLQTLYSEKYGVEFDPFQSAVFKSARETRNAKLRQLRQLPERAASKAALLSAAAPFTAEEYQEVLSLWDEDTPLGLQRKFYYVAAVELSWRGEAYKCTLDDFREEKDSNGSPTGRIAYNFAFNKNRLDTKWLIKNSENPDMCPVRLFKKLLSKRTSRITTNRLFLNVNPRWEAGRYWYKNSPVARQDLAKWTAEAAKIIGVDKTKANSLSSKHQEVSASDSAATSSRKDAADMKMEFYPIDEIASPEEDLNPIFKLEEESDVEFAEVEETQQEHDRDSPHVITTSCETTVRNGTTVIKYINCTFIINK